jgi:cell division protein FtsZ
MTINLRSPDMTELKPKITVFGIGGAGGNAVNNMIHAELEGVEFVVANTDAQALAQSAAHRRIQMGSALTQGLGAGSRPEIGRAAAEEAIEDILEHLTGSHMVFITAGMGGGTGTGAAPVVARAAIERGILTVGVVTKPFQFEGAHRMRMAEAGIEELQQYVDTLIVIPNQNLFRVANEKTTFAQAFGMADQVLHSGVRGITDLMVMPGLINLDFADVRTVMSEMGKAMMGTGEAAGEKRALDAAEAAIANPLLDDISMKGAKGVLINITGGMDLTLFEVDEAANRIRSEVDPDANIIIGSTFDDSLEGRMRVSIVATGIAAEERRASKPTTAGQAVHPLLARVQGQAGAEAVEPALVADDREAETAEVHALHAVPADEPAQMREAFATPRYEAAAADSGYETREAAQADVALAVRPAAPAQPTAQAEPAPQRSREPSFIAPAPARPTNRPQPPRIADPKRDVVAPAAERRPRGPTLLERVTGVAFGRKTDQHAAPAAVQEQPARREAAPAPAPHRTAEPALVSDGARSRVSGERHNPALEDDQLEIPAFLRRQAN